MDGDEKESDKFYSKLQHILNRINQNDYRYIILLRDFNARIGNTKVDQSISIFGEYVCNHNGVGLIDFKAMNTFFNYKHSHKFTWEAEV